MKKPCYICGDTEGVKDKSHHSRCRECKREHSRVFMKEQHQKRLEAKYLNDEKGVHFCDCGDYYVSINNKRKMCKNCHMSVSNESVLEKR